MQVSPLSLSNTLRNVVLTRPERIPQMPFSQQPHRSHSLQNRTAHQSRWLVRMSNSIFFLFFFFSVFCFIRPVYVLTHQNCSLPVSRNEYHTNVSSQSLTFFVWLVGGGCRDLNTNNLSGTIPFSFGNLTKLQYLWVANDDEQRTMRMETNIFFGSPSKCTKPALH